MRKGSILINYSRGDVVDLEALRKSLASGKLSGAAVDVFPEEPERTGDPFTCGLQNMPNVILTPHIGGSTEEAQANIGLDVTSKLVKYLDFGTSEGSHTVPPVSLPPQAGTHRILHIHQNIAGVIAGVSRVLATHGFNITGETLRTTQELGYALFDVGGTVTEEITGALRCVPGTIRVRILY